MKYKNVSLPYPVLGIYDDIYPLLEDDCIQMADPMKTATEYQFRISLKQQNKDISQLVSCGKPNMLVKSLAEVLFFADAISHLHPNLK